MRGKRDGASRASARPAKLDQPVPQNAEGIDWQAEKAKCTADILHWFDGFVWTYDPRLIGKPGGAYVRFKLWPKQRETVLWLLERIRAIEEGLIEKSRDAGATYLTAGVALHQWLFNPGFKATFGSRKVDYVDKKDNPDSIFAKIRIMLRRLPPELLPAGFSWTQHDNYMRLFNPETGAVISGEGGEDRHGSEKHEEGIEGLGLRHSPEQRSQPGGL